MADRHPYFNAKHSKTLDTDITITIIEAAARSYESTGKFGPQVQYPMTIQVNEIESVGGTVDGDDDPVIQGSLYSWFCPENVFRKICAKECNSPESSFILSRPASAQPKDSQIGISRAKSGGPNVEVDGASNGSANGDSHANGNGHANGHANGNGNGHTNGRTEPVDNSARLINTLGIGVELYVLVDRFLKSEKIAKINTERGFEYGVDEYLNLFHFFQFKYKDGLGAVQAPILSSFNGQFPEIEKALAAEAEAAKAKAAEDKIKAEEEAESEPEPQDEPVSANGASDDDDLPF